MVIINLYDLYPGIGNILLKFLKGRFDQTLIFQNPLSRQLEIL